MLRHISLRKDFTDMSNMIFYNKAYIKVNADYIPLVNQGCSNVFEISMTGQQVAEKYWAVLNHPYPGRYIFTEEEIQHIAEVYEEFSRESGGGIRKHRNVPFEAGKFKVWILGGMRYALTVEEYTHYGNCVQVVDSGHNITYTVTTTPALLEAINSIADKKAICITFKDNRCVIKRPLSQNKTVRELDEYYVLLGDQGYLVKLGPKHIWTCQSLEFGNVKKFKSREAARKYMDGYKDRFAEHHFKVRKVKNNGQKRK